MMVRSSRSSTGLQALDRVCASPGEIRWVGPVLEDLHGLARRRPELVVVAATLAGMAAGRMLRIAWADGEGAGRGHDGRGEDELEPAAVDALLRRMWPDDGRRGQPPLREAPSTQGREDSGRS